MASFLADIQGRQRLRKVKAEDVKDRSAANIRLSGKDILDDEADRWAYFFDSGCSSWFDSIKDVTFSSTFCELSPSEARIIVEHWESRERLIASLHLGEEEDPCQRPEVQELFSTAATKLTDVTQRLESLIELEAARSSVGLVFVKLSTRSPKDSKKALARAAASFYRAVAEKEELTGEKIDSNMRWRILSEETTRSVAVSCATDAMELMLDSARVYEDLEYALRGPPALTLQQSETSEGGASLGLNRPSLPLGAPELTEKAWNMSLVVRAWDPRLKPESEFRGICWDGQLTCLSQYFHPLYFPEVLGQRSVIEHDILAMCSRNDVQEAVARLGGHCLVDFAWLEPGKVVVVELNPFDGVCLGTFPASTGLFLWDDPDDRVIMTGAAPFQFRLREQPLEDTKLKVQCNQDWRHIVYGGE
ncbi:unnamed protein product, partial [Heterosigma akashiwo]